MIRTITIDYQESGLRRVPTAEVVMAWMRFGEPTVTLRGAGDHRVLYVETEAELRAALGWSAPPPPDPTARTLLDTLRDLHAEGTLADVYDIRDDSYAPLDRAVSEWAAAGYPGARMDP